MHKNISFILTAILAAVLSALATVYFLLNSSYFKAPSFSSPEASPPTYIKFDRIISNLSQDHDDTDDVQHYASVQFALKVANQQAQDAINPYIPSLKNDALLVISSKTLNDVTTNKDSIKDELLKKMNDDLVQQGSHYTISDVLFDSFVAQ